MPNRFSRRTSIRSRYVPDRMKMIPRRTGLVSCAARPGGRAAARTDEAAHRQNVNRAPICRSRGLLRSWLMNPNVALRGLVSGFQSTV